MRITLEDVLLHTTKTQSKEKHQNAIYLWCNFVQ